MRHVIWVFALTLSLIVLSGCGNKDNLSPFSPKAQMRQQLQNQNGKIGELENLNNAFKAQLSEMKNTAEVNARDIKAMQTGSNNRANSGVQLIQGDGALIVLLLLGLGGMGLAGAIYYRAKAQKSEKTAQILAEQIATVDDENLKDQICLAALHTNVESEIYKLLLKNRMIRK